MLHGLDLRIYFLWRAENKKGANSANVASSDVL